MNVVRVRNIKSSRTIHRPGENESRALSPPPSLQAWRIRVVDVSLLALQISKDRKSRFDERRERQTHRVKRGRGRCGARAGTGNWWNVTDDVAVQKRLSRAVHENPQRVSIREWIVWKKREDGIPRPASPLEKWLVKLIRAKWALNGVRIDCARWLLYDRDVSNVWPPRALQLPGWIRLESRRIVSPVATRYFLWNCALKLLLERNFFFFFFLKEVKIQNISIFTFLTSLDEKWRTRRDRQGCSWAKEKEFIATGYEHLLVGRVILRIVSLSIRMRITPHVAMLLRLQLPRLKMRR